MNAAEALAQAQSPVLQKSLSALRKAAHEVKRAWSGSISFSAGWATRG
jgi:hypothetical protein